ncbi:MAG: AEC family transporter [Myxococcales bacterium]|nr:AEC family transporter [Myxococcales bacterium]
MTATLVLMVFVVLAGRWLGGRLGAVSRADAASVLTTLVLDLTLPALTLDVLLRGRLRASTLAALGPATAAQLGVLGALWVVGRALGWSRAVMGAGLLTVGFSNTAFLGFPLVRGLFQGDTVAAQSALVVDTWNTTTLLWTLGAALAARFGTASHTGPETGLRALAAALVRPASLALVVGVAANLASLTAPSVMLYTLERVGACTSPLVFLALGLRLDLSVLRARWREAAVVTALRLGLAPALALVTALGLGVRGAPGVVAVLQSAMPTALVASLLAVQLGCDEEVATASVALTLIGSLVTLAPWVKLASALLG